MGFPDLMDYEYIESPVRELCRAINNVPMCMTLSSCGGHWSIEKKVCDCGSTECCLPINKFNIIFVSNHHEVMESFKNYEVKNDPEEIPPCVRSWKQYSITGNKSLMWIYLNFFQSLKPKCGSGIK